MSAEDVRLDETARADNRAIDMAFGSKVHDSVRPEIFEKMFDGNFIADIHFEKRVTRVSAYGPQRIEIACIGQFIDIGDLGVVRLPDQMPAYR